MSAGLAPDTTLLSDPSWRWTHEPESWEIEDGVGLAWRCRPETDLWRLTSSGVIKDDGNAFVVHAPGDFEIVGDFDAHLETRYDQVGLLVRADAENWLKAGAEWTDELLVGAVHTRGPSDWSMGAGYLPARVRIARTEGTVEVWAGRDAESLRMIRQLYLSGPVAIGPYSCSPTGPGFEARAAGLIVRLADIGKEQPTAPRGR